MSRVYQIKTIHYETCLDSNTWWKAHDMYDLLANEHAPVINVKILKFKQNRKVIGNYWIYFFQQLNAVTGTLSSLMGEGRQKLVKISVTFINNSYGTNLYLDLKPHWWKTFFDMQLLKYSLTVFLSDFVFKNLVSVYCPLDL